MGPASERRHLEVVQLELAPAELAVRSVRLWVVGSNHGERMQRRCVIAAGGQQRGRDAVRGVRHGGPAACQRVLQPDAAVTCAGGTAFLLMILDGP